MLLKEIVATRNKQRDYFCIKGAKESIFWCSRGALGEIGKSFEVPESCKKLWIQFHDRITTQRVKCQVKICKCSYCRSSGDVFPIIVVGNRRIDQPVFEELRPLIGKTVYVEVWYEE